MVYYYGISRLPLILEFGNSVNLGVELQDKAYFDSKKGLRPQQNWQDPLVGWPEKGASLPGASDIIYSHGFQTFLLAIDLPKINLGQILPYTKHRQNDKHSDWRSELSP